MEKQPKLKTKEIPRIVWFAICPECKKEISGNCEENAIRNLTQHLERHKLLKLKKEVKNEKRKI